jgi:hypothetical protein
MRRSDDIQISGNFSYTPCSIFLNDIQHCPLISQGPCGSCTSANFITIRQNFSCFLSPSKYSQNCFVIRRRSVRETIRENFCCLPSVPPAFSQHLNKMDSWIHLGKVLQHDFRSFENTWQIKMFKLSRWHKHLSKKAVAHLIIKSSARVGNIQLGSDQLSPRWYSCLIGQFRNVFSLILRVKKIVFQRNPTNLPVLCAVLSHPI